jgi:hypothetical protein
MMKASAISESCPTSVHPEKAIHQPQSPRQNCRRSFGIKTKVLLIQGMGHGVAWLHGANKTFAPFASEGGRDRTADGPSRVVDYCILFLSSIITISLMPNAQVPPNTLFSRRYLDRQLYP